LTDSAGVPVWEHEVRHLRPRAL